MQLLFRRFCSKPTHPTDRSGLLRLGLHVKVPFLRVHILLKRFIGLKCMNKVRSRAYMKQGSKKVLDLGFGTEI